MHKRIIIFSMIALFLAGTVGVLTAQNQQQPQDQQPQQPQQPQQAEDVTTEDLEKFSDVYVEVQKIQENLNEEISGMIEDSSFDQETFHNLFQAQATGDQAAASDLDDSKKQEFQELTDEITEMQNSQQENMIAAVEEEGLTVQRFNGILSAIQQDSELYAEFQEIHQN